MKRCMYCGTENDDSSQNCSKCGNRLLDIQPEQVMPAREVPEETAEEAQDTEVRQASRSRPRRKPARGGSRRVRRAGASEPEQEQPATEEEIPAEEETAENPDYPRAQEDVNDVQRGQPYAARQQYEGNGPMLHGAPGEVPEMNIMSSSPMCSSSTAGRHTAISRSQTVRISRGYRGRI